jgi:transaldolase/glucose-6-phosphate isomerase
MHLARLAELGIDLKEITQKLQDEGERLLAEHEECIVNLGEHQAAVDRALVDLKENSIISRIWQHDHTVWKEDPTEITNRLGWLHSPEVMVDVLPQIHKLVDAVRKEGYTHARLLGMGGSSLAPETYRVTFGVQKGYLELAILDSTDPGAVLEHVKRLDPAHTLFIVSTKSGGTVETISLFKFFYNWVAAALGEDRAGVHFIAITDPGSQLAETAERCKFRATFLNDRNIGGRYSALSYYGLVPAALIGVHVATLLQRAHTMACNCALEGNNAGARLGAAMGTLALAGRDKLTLVTSPPIAAIGPWLEQLIAESTGKEGKGILPVVDEPVGSPTVYGSDRLFVYLRLDGDMTHDAKVRALIDAGHAVLQLNVRDLYDLGGEFFRWEMATAVAGHILGINPFDQPNVESAKALARQMVMAYQKEGALPVLAPTLETQGIAVYGDVAAKSLSEAWSAFLAKSKPGDYVALQAYVQPTDATTVALQALRVKLRDHSKLATTLGYGPRFLHSTGQLHKGDGGNGLFVQFTSDAMSDVKIPDEAGMDSSSITFGVLKLAQALGDRQALLNAGRRVIRFHLGKDVASGLKKLTAAL